MSKTIEKLDTGVVFNKSNQRINMRDHCAGKKIGIYFGADNIHCKSFKQLLIDFYNSQRIRLNFEIVFISFDSDMQGFYKSYEEMPWLALEYNNPELKGDLCEQFDVKGTPSLVIVKTNNESVISYDARRLIEKCEGNYELIVYCL